MRKYISMYTFYYTSSELDTLIEQKFTDGLRELQQNVKNAGVALTVFANLHYADQSNIGILKPFVRDMPEIELILNSDSLDITRTQLDGIICEHNPLRSMRPARNATATSVPLHVPFNPDQFHLGLDELDAQVFHSYKDSHSAKTIDLMYNRYPFAKCHFLWIPERKSGNHPQYINPESTIIDMAWRFSQDTGTHLGYNANGAHSSVNHLHFQGYVPTAQSNIAAYTGTRCYTETFAPDELKRELRRIHGEITQGKQVSYNLLIHPKGIALYERHTQGHQPYLQKLESVGSGGFAFHELGGNVVQIAKKSVKKGEITAVYDSLRPAA
jgi:hypothetical protein